MSLEALASNKLPSFLIFDTISDSHGMCLAGLTGDEEFYSSPMVGNFAVPELANGTPPLSLSINGRKKRRRRQRSCKNREEAENHRMTHIAMERNRRRQMNEHLVLLRSLIPEFYIQRGDQASIVGGAIDFIKELEQLLQSLEAQKRTLQQKLSENEEPGPQSSNSTCGGGNNNGSSSDSIENLNWPPVAQFFACPQYIRCHSPREYSCNSNGLASIADIEVTLIETHASIRILLVKRPRQLMNMVAGFQGLQLTILHINVTTFDPLVLYSFSAQVEDGCQLTSVDDIVAAVHHMLSLIQAEAAAMS